jgi:hypothetical protein
MQMEVEYYQLNLDELLIEDDSMQLMLVDLMDFY